MKTNLMMLPSFLIGTVILFATATQARAGTILDFEAFATPGTSSNSYPTPFDYMGYSIHGQWFWQRLSYLANWKYKLCRFDSPFAFPW